MQDIYPTSPHPVLNSPSRKTKDEDRGRSAPRRPPILAWSAFLVPDPFAKETDPLVRLGAHRFEKSALHRWTGEEEVPMPAPPSDPPPRIPRKTEPTTIAATTHPSDASTHPIVHAPFHSRPPRLALASFTPAATVASTITTTTQSVPELWRDGPESALKRTVAIPTHFPHPQAYVDTIRRALLEEIALLAAPVARRCKSVMEKESTIGRTDASIESVCRKAGVPYYARAALLLTQRWEEGTRKGHAQAKRKAMAQAQAQAKRRYRAKVRRQQQKSCRRPGRGGGGEEEEEEEDVEANDNDDLEDDNKDDEASTSGRLSSRIFLCLDGNVERSSSFKIGRASCRERV